MMKRMMVVILTSGFISACSVFDTEKGLHSQQSPFAELTKPIILIGDNQEHHLGGMPIPLVINTVFDRKNEVTIRPPQQSLFGRKLLQSIVDKGASTPVIHLGDLLDVSCSAEWERVAPYVLKQNVVLAHGNHDGLAHGIFNNLKGGSGKEVFLYSIKGWKLDCLKPYVYDGLTPVKRTADDDDIKDVFTSADFIRQYSASKHNGVKPKDFTFFDFESDGMVEEIAGKIEPEGDCKGEQECRRYTNSYLIQKVRMPSAGSTPVHMFVLDTSQVDKEYSVSNISLILRGINIHKSPGMVGYMLESQLRQLKWMVEQVPQDNVVVFSGHHDWDSLDTRVKIALGKIFSERKTHPIVYFSAHTHDGFLKKHTLLSGRGLTEVNVNSLADWPVAMREMKMSMSKDRGAIKIESIAKLDDLSGSAITSDLESKWTNECVASGSITSDSFKKYDALTKVHRSGGQSAGNFFGMAKYNLFSRGGVLASNLLYEDKLNDLVVSKQVVELAMKDRQGLRKNVERYLSSDPASICHGIDFDECLATKFIVPRWEYKGVDERPKGPKAYFYPLAQFYSAAQKAIDETNNPADVSYMKCAFVSSAIADKRFATEEKKAVWNDASADFYRATIEAGM